MRSPAFLRRAYAVLARVSPGCPPLMGRFPSVPHPSASRQHVLLHLLPIDLHVLSTPPAFNLSQDQTLQLKTVRVRPVSQVTCDPSQFRPTRYLIVKDLGRSFRSRKRLSSFPHPLSTTFFHFLLKDRAASFGTRSSLSVAARCVSI